MKLNLFYNIYSSGSKILQRGTKDSNYLVDVVKYSHEAVNGGGVGNQATDAVASEFELLEEIASDQGLVVSR